MPHDQISNFKNDGFDNLTPTSAPHGVEWMRRHPYAFMTYGVVIVLIICAVALARRDTTPRGDVTAWSGTNTPITDTPGYVPATSKTPVPVSSASTSTEQPTILEDLSRNNQPVAIPSVIPETKPVEDPPFDLAAFLKQLSPNTTPSSSPTKTSQSVGDLMKEAYSYVPGGLISVQSAGDNRTELQQELFTYGNDIGNDIEAFETQYPNALAILKDQAEDRGNPSKVAALERYAAAMADVGARMRTTNVVPKEVAAAHDSLAKSYIAIGTNLALVAKTRSDADFLYAVEQYNKSVEAYTNEFVGMATLFGAYDVHFGSTDSGRIFTFTPASL